MKQSDISYITPDPPNQVRLDTTTRCNATCLSCHRFLSKRKGEMPPELILEILNDIAKWQTPLKEIVPVNYGEFFMRKDWAWILEHISSKLPFTQIVLPTNGSLFDDRVASYIVRIPQLKLINFSVNAFFEDTYEHFMGLSFKTINRIEQAIKLIRMERRDIKIWVSMVFDPEYQSDLERDNFRNFWNDKADIVWTIAAASAGRGKPIHYPVKIPCRSLFSDIVIGYDKKLSSCCFDSRFSINIGHYSGNLLQDWHNSKLEKLRSIHNEHLRSTIPLCKDCTYA